MSTPARPWELADIAGLEMAAVSASTTDALITEN